MLTIKLAPKTGMPIGSKPKAFRFQSKEYIQPAWDPKDPGRPITELDQAKQYARGQLKSTGRAWVSVEEGKTLYLVGNNADGSLFEWERKDEPKPAKAA